MSEKTAQKTREPEVHEVVLAGKTYKLRSPHEDEYLAKLAAFVSAQVAEVQRRGTVGSLDAALLAALNIADELFRLRNEAEARLAEMGEKAQALLAALDEVDPARRDAASESGDADEDRADAASSFASSDVDAPAPDRRPPFASNDVDPPAPGRTPPFASSEAEGRVETPEPRDDSDDALVPRAKVETG